MAKAKAAAATFCRGTRRSACRGQPALLRWTSLELVLADKKRCVLFMRTSRLSRRTWTAGTGGLRVGRMATENRNRHETAAGGRSERLEWPAERGTERGESCPTAAASGTAAAELVGIISPGRQPETCTSAGRAPSDGPAIVRRSGGTAVSHRGEIGSLARESTPQSVTAGPLGGASGSGRRVSCPGVTVSVGVTAAAAHTGVSQGAHGRALGGGASERDTNSARHLL